jgi:ABC-type uncharacterized transport system substrate-binding protein
MRTLAKELVDLRPNAILGVTTPVIAALARETRTISIVFTGDTPALHGLVQSLTSITRANRGGDQPPSCSAKMKLAGLL